MTDGKNLDTLTENLSPKGLQLASKPFINRNEGEALSVELGTPVKAGYLQKLASVGGGPPYRIFGRTALMVPAEFIEWLLSRLSSPRTNTSALAFPETKDQPTQGTDNAQRAAGGCS